MDTVSKNITTPSDNAAKSNNSTNISADANTNINTGANTSKNRNTNTDTNTNTNKNTDSPITTVTPSTPPKFNNRSNMASTKEPSTPSFDSHHSFPQTPERTPRQLLNEGTPLLSPSIHNLTTPQKRKGSTDFYSLLKSPEANRNQLTSDEKSIKRRSMELNKIINKSPEKFNSFVFHDNYRSAPISHQNPKLGLGENQNQNPKDDKEIKKISENLKTRLNYANLKIQHGWSNKSIGELEQSLEEKKHKRLSSGEETNKQYDEFWNLQKDKLPSTTQYSNESPNLSSLSPKRFSSSPIFHHRRRSLTSKIKLDDIANKHGSADKALLNALSPEKHNLHIHTSPLKKPNTNKTAKPNSGHDNSDNRLEQDAIMSLISLSSPVKYSGSNSPSPPMKSASINASPRSSISTLLPPPLPSPSHNKFQIPPLSPTRGYSLSQPPLLPRLSEDSPSAIDEDSTEDEYDPDDNDMVSNVKKLPSLRTSISELNNLNEPIKSVENIKRTKLPPLNLQGLGLSSLAGTDTNINTNTNTNRNTNRNTNINTNLNSSSRDTRRESVIINSRNSFSEGKEFMSIITDHKMSEEKDDDQTASEHSDAM